MKKKAQEGNQHTWCAGAIKSKNKGNNQRTCDEKLQSKALRLLKKLNNIGVKHQTLWTKLFATFCS